MEKSQEQINFTSIVTFYCKRMEKSKEQIQDFTTVVTLKLLETTVLPCWEKSISLPPLNFLVQWQRRVPMGFMSRNWLFGKSEKDNILSSRIN